MLLLKSIEADYVHTDRHSLTMSLCKSTSDELLEKSSASTGVLMYGRCSSNSLQSSRGMLEDLVRTAVEMIETLLVEPIARVFMWILIWSSVTPLLKTQAQEMSIVAFRRQPCAQFS